MSWAENPVPPDWPSLTPLFPLIVHIDPPSQVSAREPDYRPGVYVVVRDPPGTRRRQQAGVPYPSRSRQKVADFLGCSEADAGTRTGDPFITSEVLYQLSYVGA